LVCRWEKGIISVGRRRGASDRVLLRVWTLPGRRFFYARWATRFFTWAQSRYPFAQRRKAASSGVFVSSGALGVSLGAYLEKQGCSCLGRPRAFACLRAAYFSSLRDAAYAPRPHLKSPHIFVRAVLSLCLTAVLLRALLASTLPVPWQSAGVLCVPWLLLRAFGKAAGGVLATALAQGA
jgi:hypothetical protein